MWIRYSQPNKDTHHMWTEGDKYMQPKLKDKFMCQTKFMCPRQSTTRQIHVSKAVLVSTSESEWTQGSPRECACRDYHENQSASKWVQASPSERLWNCVNIEHCVLEISLDCVVCFDMFRNGFRCDSWIRYNGSGGVAEASAQEPPENENPMTPFCIISDSSLFWVCLPHYIRLNPI